MKRARRLNSVALVGAIFLASISFLACFPSLLTPYSFEEQRIEEHLQGSSALHWIGTDNLGRDLLARLLYGARMSLAVGILTAFFALTIGIATGAVAGYWGGSIDRLIMRIVDSFQIFPYILLAILLMTLTGQGITGVFLALGLSTWGNQARLTRGLVLQYREYAFVESARAAGATSWRIIWKHLLPNLTGPIVVSLSFQIPTNIMAESFLSFLGLGLQPPHSSWGTLAADGFRAMRSYPHLILWPSLVLFLTMLAFHALGEGIRDALDPH